MSRQREPGGIDPLPSFIQVKGFKILNCVGREAMHYVMTVSCPSLRTQNLRDYLTKEKKMAEQYYEKWFSKQQQEKILSDPQGDDFDITLLYRCLGVPLPGLLKLGNPVWTHPEEERLEYLITQIKEERNNLVHEKEIRSEEALCNLAADVKVLLAKTYRLAAKQYSRDDAEANISDMESEIDRIVQAPYMSDFEKWQKEMQYLYKQQTDRLREASEDLKREYKRTSRIHPASFLTHVESLQVQTVYCKEVKVEKMLKDKKERLIGHNDMLNLQTVDGEEPSVMVVEAEAGMGKTSLVKFILAEWSSTSDHTLLPEHKILGLDEYELLLHFEFRNQCISTFLDLLISLFDSSSLLLPHSRLESLVLSMKTLVLLDGADEWNESSKQLLRELVEKAKKPESKGKLRVLCTTRPERCDKLLQYVSPLSWVRLRITGVPPDRQFPFTKTYMERMLEDNTTPSESPSSLSSSDTQIEGLRSFMERSQAQMGEQFKLPLNLALLAYLWIHDSDRICQATSVTELYTAFQELALRRLLSRLVHRTEMEREDLEKLCNEFLGVLYRECLTALSQDFMQMPQDCTERLKAFCDDRHLPSSDMIENYMDVYNEWGSNGYLAIVAPPHKSKLEFFSAHAVITDLCGAHNTENILEKMQWLLDSCSCPLETRQEILDFAKDKLHECDLKTKTIRQVLEGLRPDDPEADLSRYRNMLVMMCGIMFHSHRDHLHHRGPELLDLLSDGEQHTHQYLSIVAETKNDSVVAGLVAPRLRLGKKPLKVSDGHVGAARAVLPHLDEKTDVTITLEGDPRHLPDLDDLVRLVASRPCYVTLELKRLLRTPDADADRLLDILQGGRCSLIHLEGHLTRGAKLSGQKLKRLALSAATDSNPALPILQHLSSLFRLDIHLSRKVTLEHLPQLPTVIGSGISLHLHDVDDSGVEWTVRAVRNLLPASRKFYLNFSESELSAKGLRDVVRCFEDLSVGGERVEVERIVVPARTVSDDDLKKLKEELQGARNTRFKCEFSRT